MLLTAATLLLALPSPREEARRRGPHALLPQTRNAAGECPEGCDPVSTVTVHGDPMFKVNGTGTHFWIKAGTLTPLLTWPLDDESVATLSGRTIDNAATGNQW